MGSEWERKRAAGFRKRLDQKLIDLGTPDLFTQTPERAARVVAADIADGASVAAGENLVVQKIGTRLALMSGLHEVGQLSKPHPEIISAVEKSCGVAKAVVQVFHSEASMAEISIC